MKSSHRSIPHTLQKGFTLLMFAGFLTIVFNPQVQGKTLKIKLNADSAMTGFWYGTQTGDSLYINFKIPSKSIEKSFTEGDFKMTDLISSKDQKGYYVMQTDAGVILFTGKFIDRQAQGHYKLTPNENYIDKVKRVGVTTVDLYTLLRLICYDVSADFLDEMANDGFRDMNVSDLCSMCFFKMNRQQLHYWAHSGFTNLTSEDILMIAITHLDSAYSESIKKIFPKITLRELRAFKAADIDEKYIRGMSAAQINPQPDSTYQPFTPGDLISAKYRKIDSAYVKQMAIQGLYLNGSDLFSFKWENITPGYVKALHDMGFTQLTPKTVSVLHAADITPDYVKSFDDLGYKNIKPAKLIIMKNAKLTPEYVNELRAMGYKQLDLETLISLKSMEVNTNYIKGFNDLGFEHISTEQLLQLKTCNVTPDYIASMRQKGLNSRNIRNYIVLKKSFN